MYSHHSLALVLTKLKGYCDDIGFRKFKLLYTLIVSGYWWHSNITYSLYLYPGVWADNLVIPQTY